jgi:hypothetical protein
MDPVRCPYCVESDNFREMMSLADGSFVCRGCGHIVPVPRSSIRCECLKCRDVRRPIVSVRWRDAHGA